MFDKVVKHSANEQVWTFGTCCACGQSRYQAKRRFNRDWWSGSWIKAAESLGFQGDFFQGTHDASYRGGNQILTPNIDSLVYHGVAFDYFYTGHICTPSRTALMTGKYAHSCGLQAASIPATERKWFKLFWANVKISNDEMTKTKFKKKDEKAVRTKILKSSVRMQKFRKSKSITKMLPKFFKFWIFEAFSFSIHEPGNLKWKFIFSYNLNFSTFWFQYFDIHIQLSTFCFWHLDVVICFRHFDFWTLNFSSFRFSTFWNSHFIFDISAFDILTSNH